MNKNIRNGINEFKEKVMDINTLKDKIQENDLECNLFFTRKLRNGNYVSFSPILMHKFMMIY